MDPNSDPQLFRILALLVTAFVVVVAFALISIYKKKTSERRNTHEVACIYCGSFDDGENCPHCEPKQRRIHEELLAASEFATT